MHEMQTIVTDARGVCLSVCLSRGLNRRRKCLRRERKYYLCILLLEMSCFPAVKEFNKEA